MVGIQNINSVVFRGTKHTNRKETASRQNLKSHSYEQENNTSQYIIGATAVASLVMLAIAGYKGHLGEGIQKFLGGKKTIKDANPPKTEKDTTPLSHSSMPSDKASNKQPPLPKQPEVDSYMATKGTSTESQKPVPEEPKTTNKPTPNTRRMGGKFPNDIPPFPMSTVVHTTQQAPQPPLKPTSLFPQDNTVQPLTNATQQAQQEIDNMTAAYAAVVAMERQAPSAAVPVTKKPSLHPNIVSEPHTPHATNGDGYTIPPHSDDITPDSLSSTKVTEPKTEIPTSEELHTSTGDDVIPEIRSPEPDNYPEDSSVLGGTGGFGHTDSSEYPHSSIIPQEDDPFSHGFGNFGSDESPLSSITSHDDPFSNEGFGPQGSGLSSFDGSDLFEGGF